VACTSDATLSAAPLRAQGAHGRGLYAAANVFEVGYEAKKAADPAFGDKTIFIDITSFNQTEINSRRRGRGLEGYPVFGEAPSDRGENWDLLIGINRLRGVLAGFVYEGHTDAEVVAAWIEHVLLPQCQDGDWVILDGASYWRQQCQGLVL